MISLDIMAERFAAAIAWLEEQGLSVTGTRLARYAKVIADVIAAIGAQKDYAGDVARYHQALMEICEICEIHEGVRHLPFDDEMHRRLKTMLGGGFSHIDEAGPKGRSSEPRDYAFEMLTVSLLANANVNRRPLPTTGDVIFRVGGSTIFGECKRVASIDKLQYRVKEGLRQIKVRRFRNPGALGVVFVDVTPYFNQAVPAYEVDNFKTMDSGLDEFMQRVKIRLRELIPKAYCGPSTLGFFIRNAAVCWLNEERIVTYRQSWLFDPHYCSRIEHFPVIRSFAAAIDEAIPGERLRFVRDEDLNG